MFIPQKKGFLSVTYSSYLSAYVLDLDTCDHCGFPQVRSALEGRLNYHYAGIRDSTAHPREAPVNDENNFQDAGAAPSPQAQAPQPAPAPAAPAAGAAGLPAAGL